jgi:tetratricopeptide (TPR) repeat protein
VKQAVLALVVIVSWTAPVAHAAPTRAPAVDHYQVGKRLFEQKRYAEALEQFRQALLLTPRPEVLYSMAQTQRLLGDCASAVSTYRAFLAARPGEPLAEYARANIARCEQKPTSAPPAGPAWYRDIVGDVLVGGGLVAGATGAVIWHSGRAAAMNLANAPDYQTFLARQSAASSALTEQRVGIAAMIVGGVAVIAGVVHYVHQARSPHRESSLGVALTAGGALITGRGTF